MSVIWQHYQSTALFKFIKVFSCSVQAYFFFFSDLFLLAFALE